MFKKGDKVFVRDFPFGKPLNVRGTVVGKIGQEHYNVLIDTGILEGKIIKYKYWKLMHVQNREQGNQNEP